MNSTRTARLLSPSNSRSSLKAELGIKPIAPVANAPTKNLKNTSSDEDFILRTVDVGAAWLGMACKAQRADPRIDRQHALTAAVGSAFLNLEAGRLNAATALAGNAWLDIASASQAAPQETPTASCGAAWLGMACKAQRADPRIDRQHALTAAVGSAFLNLEAGRLNAATALAGNAWLGMACKAQRADPRIDRQHALTAAVGSAFLNLEAGRLNAATALAGNAWLDIASASQAAPQETPTASCGAAWLGMACKAQRADPANPRFDAATARAGNAFLNLFGCQVRLGNSTALIKGLSEEDACC